MIEPVEQAEVSARILQGDCLQILKELPDNSIDSCVTDPPAAISFMGKSWDGDRGGRTQWVAWLSEVMAEVMRVVKPGGHALVWALPRTSHWTALALEDAGWEIRDRIAHHFGSGFPKSKNLGNGQGSALKPATEDWWLCRKPLSEKNLAQNVLKHGTGGLNIDASRVGAGEHVPGGGGWTGTGRHEGYQRPAHADGMPTQAHNHGRFPANLLLSHHEDCQRVGSRRVRGGTAYEPESKQMNRSIYGATNTLGRTEGYADPDGTEEVEAWECVEGCPVKILGEPARFFRAFAGEPEPNWGAIYSPKASRAERNKGLEGMPESVSSVGNKEAAGRDGAKPGNALPGGARARVEKGLTPTIPRANNHPTVKPTKLLSYLIRLVTPLGGTTLDPFAGSGSTGVAAISEGFNAILIEADPEYVEIAKARCAHALNEQAGRLPF